MLSLIPLSRVIGEALITAPFAQTCLSSTSQCFPQRVPKTQDLLVPRGRMNGKLDPGETATRTKAAQTEESLTLFQELPLLL